jgi:HSP20 family molecular chaperone IbpA
VAVDNLKNEVPCEVESDKADASFKDGILTVVIRKTKAVQERSKKIPIDMSQRTRC